MKCDKEDIAVYPKVLLHIILETYPMNCIAYALFQSNLMEVLSNMEIKLLHGGSPDLPQDLLQILQGMYRS